MRTVHVHSSAPTPSTVQVPGTAPVQTIVQRVNAAYAQGITAQPATVQLFINGKAVADLHTTQVMLMLHSGVKHRYNAFWQARKPSSLM